MWQHKQLNKNNPLYQDNFCDMIFLSINLYAQCCTTEALPNKFKEWCCNSIQTQKLVKHFQKIILPKYILLEHLDAELKMTHPESQQRCGIENW